MVSLMILEPHCEGHHMQWVRWIAQEAVSRGHDVVLVTLPYCLEHPSYLTIPRECKGRILTTVFPHDVPLSKEWSVKQNTANLIRRELTYYGLFSTYLRRLPKDERPDLVFIPYLDYCVYAAALLGSPFGKSPWGGIVQRPSFHFRSVGVWAPSSRSHLLKERLFFRLLGSKSLRKLFTIDETLVQYANQNRSSSAEKLRFVPEPYQFDRAHSRTQARLELGISDGTVVLLVYGALNGRKGIDALLSALRQSDFPDEVDILLAGVQDEDVRRLLASPEFGALRNAERLHEQNWFLSDEEEHMVFQAADIVWLGYKRHYTRSGVLIQAGMMGLPVVACEAGLLGWLTRKHNLGLSVSVDDAGAVVEAIKTLARERDLSNYFGRNGRKHSADYTVKEFAGRICDGLHLA